MLSQFGRLPPVPDHPRLEQEVLDRWERDRTFNRLRERNADGPRFSFFDGPVTANKAMGVHTAWGRTLKDVFVRYKGLRGFHQRYQNGWDCQGLWIEVGVEKSLGLNSKHEIEQYGLDRFAERCREVVAWSSGELRRASIRLGQWMDWERDYYTFSDTNIDYIWRFLKVVHDREWLFRGHRSTEWCPRCGTSLSQHELSQSGVHQEREDPSLKVRFSLLDRPDEALVIWTTSPWTLPANVAAAVNPELEYGRYADGDWVAVASDPDGDFAERLPGADLVGWRYRGPFDDLGPGSGVEHRVIPWEDVALDTGTGIVHIAPGAGPEDFELSREHDLPVLAPVDESGRFYPKYGWLAGMTTAEAAEPIIEALRERGVLVRAETILHAYPHCWRCDTPLIFRIADDWYISVEGVRQRMLDENAKIEWTPPQYGKRMNDWLRNMGDWNISRRRFYGLPLPFYPCRCGHLNVIGSRRELEARAIRGTEGLRELHRPWIDDVVIGCEDCGEPVERVTEVGDVWLDAGIVPFSTLGWQSPDFVPEGNATGAAGGLTRADLPDHAFWEEWFPADWVTEMREQIRLWFYSLFFMSVVLTGRAPYRKVLTYEKLLDAKGREMHGSWGNQISADEAFERMGADVMRWLYCQQQPSQNIRFGFAPADDVKRRLLTLWNSARFLADYGRIEGFEPRYADLETGVVGVELRPLDRWLQSRVQQLLADAEAAYDAYRSVEVLKAFESFVDDLSNWYIRRSRRRFYSYDEAAFRSLWTALVQSLRVVAPVLPMLADHLWKVLVADVAKGAPDSIHLAGWPETHEQLRDERLLAETAAVRHVVQLGRRARAQSGVKLRQPLRLLYVRGAPDARDHADEIADELRVKRVEFDAGPVTAARLLPNLRLLGPRLGPRLRDVRAALEHGAVERLEDGSFRVAGEVLAPEEVIQGERHELPGWATAEAEGISVAFDVELDDELRTEGRVLDLIHSVNALRKASGIEVTDRVTLTLPSSEADLLPHSDWIAREVLAIDVEVDGEIAEPAIAKV
nr:isoleucine--tRNA ligase [Actinomycetota bacterium]